MNKKCLRNSKRNNIRSQQSQMIALKHEVRMLPGEAITRKDFEDSWQKTRRELGL